MGAAVVGAAVVGAAVVGAAVVGAAVVGAAVVGAGAVTVAVGSFLGVKVIFTVEPAVSTVTLAFWPFLPKHSPHA